MAIGSRRIVTRVSESARSEREKGVQLLEDDELIRTPLLDPCSAELPNGYLARSQPSGPL